MPSPVPASPRRNNSGLRRLCVVLIVITIVLGIVAAFVDRGGGSSYNREPIATGVPFDNNCIVDELGWFDNIGNASRRLQNFYDETGVQPFVYLKAYDPGLMTDADKESYANDWYESNIDNESTFLYMYFAEADQDNDVGFMAYVNGKQVSSVMDAEAVGIFWDKLDNAWYKDMSTDDMFVSVFDSTARTIMTKSTTGLDVLHIVIGLCAIMAGVSGVILIMRTRREHEAERNAETERILRTDLTQAGDDLLDKWSDK